MSKEIIKELIVDNNHIDLRLDKYLVQHLNLNRSQINNLLENQLVLINDILPKKNGQLLKLNDNLKILKQNKIVKKIEPYYLKLDILYEDRDLIIVNKPSGLLTHETQYYENQTLLNALNTYSNGEWEPYLVHRLDKDTSGLIIFAKNKFCQELLLKMFMNRQIIKKYLAIVHGQILQKHFFIDVAIARSNDNKLKMIAGEGKNAKQALSEINVLKIFENYSLIEIILHTGRTHQIRVHSNYINHPIVNDPIYSPYKSNSKYGQYLMAYYLKFKHPISQKEIEIKIESDKEFKNFEKLITN